MGKGTSAREQALGLAHDHRPTRKAGTPRLPWCAHRVTVNGYTPIPKEGVRVSALMDTTL